MKEHLRKYFPDRYQTSEPISLSKVAKFLMLGEENDGTILRCEMTVSRVFSRSNELKLLAGALRKYGCNFNLLRHTVCERCIGCHGGYDPDTNQIVLCHNKNLTDNKVMATMMHEMIHMFDYCRAKFDFDNLEHVACSEIRAANLSYCTVTDKFNFGGVGLFEVKKMHPYCVKDVALRSVQAYAPDVEIEKLHAIVDKVFPYCYNDLEPFGRRPVNGSHDLMQSYRERFYYGYV